MFSKKELLNIKNPAYIIGEEIGSIIKNNSKINIAMFVPKYYNIAMKNIYMNSLYNFFNSLNDVYIQRVFLIEDSCEKILKENNESIFTIEKKEYLNKMNFVIIILEDELEITSCLNFLSLSKIPILKTRREDKHPKIIFFIKKDINPYSIETFADYIFYIEDKEKIKNICNLFNIDVISRNNSKIIDLYIKNNNTYYPTYIKNALVSSISIENDNILIILNGCYSNSEEIYSLIHEINKGYEQTGIKNICFFNHDDIKEEDFLDIVNQLRESLVFKKSKILFDDLYLNEKNIWKIKYMENYFPKIKVVENSYDDIIKIMKKLLKEGYKEIQLIYEIKSTKTNFNKTQDVFKLAEDISELYFMYYLIKPKKPIVNIILLYYNLNSMLIPEKLESKISFLKSQNINKYVTVNSENEYKIVLKYILKNLKKDVLGNIIYKAWKARS